MLRVDSEKRQYGVHHRTALAACQIVANNASQGFLALDIAGNQRAEVLVPLDGVLVGAEYYFVVPGSCMAKYPIVPSFGDWQFPHDRVPDFWPQPARYSRNFSEPLAPQDCAVTEQYWAKGAHLIPRNERAWFTRNGMSRYGFTVVGNIDTDPANRISLTSKIQKRPNSHAFTLSPQLPYPRPPWTTVPSQGEGASSDVASAESTPPQQQELEYAVHVLVGADPAFARDHHGIRLPLARLAGCAREYLYARFALNIFMGVRPFVTAGLSRRVARFMVEKDGWGRSDVNLVEDYLDEPALEALYGPGPGGSYSTGPAQPEVAEEQESDWSSDDEED